MPEMATTPWHLVADGCESPSDSGSRGAGAAGAAADACEPGEHDQHVGAERRDLAVDLAARAGADGDHHDHRADADDDAERRQDRAQHIGAQCGQRDLQAVEDDSFGGPPRGYGPAGWTVLDDVAVAEQDAALGIGGDVGLVRDHDDGDALPH